MICKNSWSTYKHLLCRFNQPVHFLYRTRDHPSSTQRTSRAQKTTYRIYTLPNIELESKSCPVSGVYNNNRAWSLEFTGSWSLEFRWGAYTSTEAEQSQSQQNCFWLQLFSSWLIVWLLVPHHLSITVQRCVGMISSGHFHPGSLVLHINIWFNSWLFQRIVLLFSNEDVSFKCTRIKTTHLTFKIPLKILYVFWTFPNMVRFRNSMWT